MQTKQRKEPHLQGRTLRPSHIFLRIMLEVHEVAASSLSSNALACCIDRALREAYGEMGSLRLSYEFVNIGEHAPATAVIKVPREYFAQVWAALSLLSTYEQKRARILVTHATPFPINIICGQQPPIAMDSV